MGEEENMHYSGMLQNMLGLEEFPSDEEDTQEVDDTIELIDDAEENAEEEPSLSENEEESSEVEGGDIDEECGGQGGKKRKQRAAIWETAAKKVKMEGVVKAQCLVCNQYYNCNRLNTSAIRNHVKDVHPGTEECKKFLALEKKRKEDAAKKAKPKSKNTMMNFITMKKALSKKERIGAVEDFLIQSNISFSTVENPAFRKMLFTFNSGYVAPSRSTITSHIDQKIKEKKEELRKEIEEDTRESRTASVTTDGGPSQDKNNTKKNSVTISRISYNFKMKTDTLALEIANGSQTGPVIRAVVKGVLDKFGFKGDVNMTTDDASAARSARTANRHPEVGLTIKYEVMCLDHQIHLLVSSILKKHHIFFFLIGLIILLCCRSRK